MKLGIKIEYYTHSFSSNSPSLIVYLLEPREVNIIDGLPVIKKELIHSNCAFSFDQTPTPDELCESIQIMINEVFIHLNRKQSYESKSE